MNGVSNRPQKGLIFKEKKGETLVEEKRRRHTIEGLHITSAFDVLNAD